MKSETSQLLAEIKDLTEQYRIEVPGRHRTWPESIKARIRRLAELGVKPVEISKGCGVPYETLLNWVPKECRGQRRRKEKGSFTEVQLAATPPQEVATVTATDPNATVAVKTQNATVTVTLPNGARIEGVTSEFLRSWLGRGEPV